jgi:hypothetical protein
LRSSIKSSRIPGILAGLLYRFAIEYINPLYPFKLLYRRLSAIGSSMESLGLSLLLWLALIQFASAFSIQSASSFRRPFSSCLDHRYPTRLNAATSSSSSSSSDSVDGSKSRAERIQEEMANAKSMKVGDLKKELESRGISTKSFFEKSEFVRAYAEAIVDNVSKSKSGSSSSSSTSSARKQAAAQDEPYDPSYRDVTTQRFNARDPRLLSGVVIDIALGR